MSKILYGILGIGGGLLLASHLRKKAQKVDEKNGSYTQTPMYFHESSYLGELERNILTLVSSDAESHPATIRASLSKYAESIKEAWDKYGIDPNLTMAVIWMESRGKSDAIGRGGYHGLMQVGMKTAKWLGFKDTKIALYDPRTNIMLGSKLLAWLLKQTKGDIRRALMRYDGGRESYADRVMAYYTSLRESMG